jgi:hypothetical protein
MKTGKLVKKAYFEYYIEEEVTVGNIGELKNFVESWIKDALYEADYLSGRTENVTVVIPVGADDWDVEEMDSFVGFNYVADFEVYKGYKGTERILSGTAYILGTVLEEKDNRIDLFVDVISIVIDEQRD